MISMVIAIALTYFAFNPMVRRGATGFKRTQRDGADDGGMADGCDGGPLDRIFLSQVEVHRSRQAPRSSCSLSLAALALAQQAATQAANGEEVFNARCKSCHDPAVERAPGRSQLAFRRRRDIIASLTSGVMAPMAQGLSRAEIEAVALYLAPGQQSGPPAPTRCVPPMAPSKPSASDWPSSRTG